jgi:nucleotide-binding universal stress UspA family protein
MTKILVPVDFTKTSFSAYLYAVQLARDFKAEITLFHVINGSFSTADSMFLDTLDAANEAANKRLRFFAKDYGKSLNITSNVENIKYEVRFGVAGFTIADFANDKGFDYVVIGTRDNHNIIERILGTTSAIVTKLTSCPVLLIHESTRFIKPHKIIFTIDDKTDFNESIDDFIKFNDVFQAPTDFIHIKNDDKSLDATKGAVLEEIFKKQEPNFSFEIKNIYGGDIVQSIVDYSIFEKADLLVMVHRKRSFLGAFFDRSISLKTAEGIHLPIMILEENMPSKN